MRPANSIMRNRTPIKYKTSFFTLILSQFFFNTREIGVFRIFFACLLCLSFSSKSFAEIIFGDKFNNELNTRLSWITPNQPETSVDFSEKGLTLTNDHSYNSMIMVHSLVTKPSMFSMTVRIISGGPGSGLFFNVTTDKSGTYNGYAAVISYGKVEIIKYYSGSISTISSISSPFIRSSDNILTISKYSDYMLIFCNGYYISKVKENELSDGDCAIIIQPTSRAIFSDFEINSQLKDSLQFPVFNEYFTSSDCFGWQKNGNGTIEVKDTKLSIRTGKYQKCTYGIKQPLRNYSLRTTVKWDIGNDSTVYGLYLSTNGADSSNKFGVIKYGINQKKECFFINSKDSIVFHKKNTPLKKVFDVPQSEWDTLKLIQTNSNIQCYLNNEIVLEMISNEEITGAGIFVKQGLNVYFDDFEMRYIGLDSGITQNITTNKSIHMNKNIYSSTMYTDLLGRSTLYVPGSSLKRTPQFIVNKSKKQTLELNFHR